MQNDSVINTEKYENYLNRETSLIEFNRRVLLEAEGNKHPLLERLKFISILSANLDEFFMIRVAGLKTQIAAGVEDLSYDGKTAKQQISEIREMLLPIYEYQSRLWNEEIVPELNKEGIFIHKFDQLFEEEKVHLRTHFTEQILPVLTPLILDSAHPFPRLIDRSLNIAFIINDESSKFSEKKVAFLQIPALFDRFIKIERESGFHFILIESLIRDSADLLFPGLQVEAANTFRVTRDADIEISEDEAEDLISEIEEQLKQRKFGRAAIRLEVNANMPQELVDLLSGYLDLEDEDIYIINRPLKMPDFMALTKLDLAHLKDQAFHSRIAPELAQSNNIFEAISKNDIFLHHPYDSFSNSTLRLISDASKDKNVMAIKITLYRVGSNPLIVKALKDAAENGKDVTAFVELKARFDEENNIIWSRDLEQSGVKVIYGVIGLKTHCKIALIIRKESNKLKSYVHVGTGNYNHVTSRLYTDVSVLTANPNFGDDAIHLFNYLTGISKYNSWKELVVAPNNLMNFVISKIEQEIEKSTPEKPGLIIAKMNQLAQREVIQALYKASMAGVKIKLIVRGVCCLKPNIEGVSNNIEVRSIIGRFLEHSRIFYFQNGGEPEYFISSADWMTRNLQKRVEIMSPVHSKKIQKKLWNLLAYYWKDNCKSWILQNDGTYIRNLPQKNEHKFDVQNYLLSIYNKKKK